MPDWTEEQKQSALARLTLGDKPIQIARDLGIPPGTVRYWKSVLPKIQGETGLSAHFEHRRKFVNKAWRIIEKGLDQLEEEIVHETNTRSLIVAIKDLFDRVVRALPEAQKGKSKEFKWDEVTTEELRIIIAEVKRKGVRFIEQAGGEVIEAEVREIEGGE